MKKSIYADDRTQIEIKWLSYRLRILPEQLDNARRKVRALENEARRYGMEHLLGGGDAA